MFVVEVVDVSQSKYGTCIVLVQYLFLKRSLHDEQKIYDFHQRAWLVLLNAGLMLLCSPECKYMCLLLNTYILLVKYK